MRVRYRIRSSAADIDAIALAVAVEQSVEVPLDVVRDPWVREHIVGRVEDITPAGAGYYAVDISLAADSMLGADGVPSVAQTFNMLFGNSSMHDMVELQDVGLPDGFAQHFGGPRFGIDGIRELLGVDTVTASARALTCAALKPQGLPVAELARLCRTFARSGIDVIKDDHGLADQHYAPFAERVRACQRAVAEAERETGRRVLYAPNLIGAPHLLAAHAGLLRDEGVGAALVAPMLVGLPAFHELVGDHLDIPVLAHPAFCGSARIDRTLLLGRLYRMLGADAVIYPHYMGRFAWSEALCGEIAQAALAPWAGIRRALPVPAGGMTVERVPELLHFYGSDVMLLIGGSLLQAGDSLAARTRAFVQAANAARH
ncbi:MAG: ribulose 1,5-bisphosphate carboxylase [Betaproteobacteria bacterium]|nr:ribulose 1,5-bisphosphate carboxylase [Betaproteobacteria bacterium]